MAGRIFDCFPFYNEFDILEIRLEELWDTVDYFVISEANTTHQSNPKNFYLKDNWSRFEKYASKIRHVMVEDMPKHSDTWVNERFQRHAIARGLTDLQPDDIVCVSDCDEVPRAAALAAIRDDNNDYDRYILAIPLHYFRLNYVMTTPVFKQNNIIVTRGRVFTNPQDERAITFSTGNLPMHFANDQICVIEHGGWHWTYFGDTEHAKNKIRNFAHAETNVPWIMDNLDVDGIVKGKYGIGWDKGNERFEYVTLDDYYPQYILDNLEKYKHMIVDDATQSVYDFYPE
jgi:hypothetical protein